MTSDIHEIDTPDAAAPDRLEAPAPEAEESAEETVMAADPEAEEDAGADDADADADETAAADADRGDSERGDSERGDSERGDMDAADFDNLRLVEALLFASAEPLAPAQLARFLPDDCKIEPLLADLEALYANRGVNLVKRGGRWAFRTAADLAPRMELENKVVRKLSRVALETLAVIAYHQPITRAEIEEIRGVALSKGTLDALLEIGWIRPKGRRKTPGRPVTWGTSEAFLDHFGLESLDALPGVEELKAAGLLDARPALTALSDRGLLPAAGEVAPEAVDEEEEDGEESAEGREQELLEEAFGENLLPHEVDLAAAGGVEPERAAETPAEAEDGPDGAPDEAEVEMFGGAEDAADPSDEEDGGDETAAEESLEDGLPDDLEADDEEAADEEAGDEDEADEESSDDDEALHHQRQRSAGRA